jgi:hypothetical protein
MLSGFSGKKGYTIEQSLPLAVAFRGPAALSGRGTAKVDRKQ